MIAPQGMQRNLRFLVFCLIFLPVPVFATVVKVWGAPAAAVQALRRAQPETRWLDEADSDATVLPQLQIAWQLDAYQRLQAAGSRQPVLLLSAQRLPYARLRAQDATLVWGPPLALQIRLARRLMPQASRIGILHQRQSQSELDVLSAPSGSQLVPLVVETPLTARALAEAADQVDILIASNDEALFNRETAKLILLTAYHHQRAVVGPTPAFVSAGAVATEAVPKAVLIEAIVASVNRWRSTGSLGEDQAIQQFAPVINGQVARSLSLQVSPDLLREVRP